MIFIRGDVSDGSDNDILLKSIIGPNWKILSGADQPIYSPGASPGYKHEEYWPDILLRSEERKNKGIKGDSCLSEENSIEGNTSSLSPVTSSPSMDDGGPTNS